MCFSRCLCLLGQPQGHWAEADEVISKEKRRRGEKKKSKAAKGKKGSLPRLFLDCAEENREEMILEVIFIIVRGV